MFEALPPGLSLIPAAPDALTERLHTTVPLHLRNAVLGAAERGGTSVAGFIRETLAERIAREAALPPSPSAPTGRSTGD